MSNLVSKIVEVLENYNKDRNNSKYPGDRKITNTVTKEIPKILKESLVNLRGTDWLFEGSAGKGNWATVPWIAILNSNVTDSVSAGIFLVFLFSAKGNKVYLALQQGTGGMDKVQSDEKQYKERIKYTNFTKSKSISFNFGALPKNSLEGGGSSKPRAYESACIFWKEYTLESLKNKITDGRILKDIYEIIDIFSQVELNNIDLPRIKKDDFDINKFIQQLKKTNLLLPKSILFRFIASLLSKQFVLLTGLSGSGKTKIAEAFSSWITLDNKQTCFVSVGADWTNREPLLGFPNALDPGKYIKPDTGVVDLLLNASNDPVNPYFLILDEMNLSHVERYFADFLSAMESIEGYLYIHPESTEWENSDFPPRIYLPKNLFIIGTVNIDETTYMFSPKVLDRANVIEFRVSINEMDNFFDNFNEIDFDTFSGNGSSMGRSFVEIAKEFARDGRNLKEELMPFFSKLQEAGSEFGYRTASEISAFVEKCSGLVNNEMSRDEIIDASIMQKLLPKLHGSRNKIEHILKELGYLCLKNPEKKEFPESTSDNIRYPVSYEKLQRMHKRVILDGFTSYAEA